MFSDFEQIKAEYWRVVCDSTQDCASLFLAGWRDPRLH